MSIFRTIMLLVLFGVFTVGLTSCPQQQPAEEEGAEVEIEVEEEAVEQPTEEPAEPGDAAPEEQQ
jgi:hypothetical protein